MKSIHHSRFTCLLACALLCAAGRVFAAADRSFVSGNFALALDNVNCGFVKSVAGGGISAVVINEPAGPDYLVKKHIGQPRYEDFSMEIGFSMTKGIYDWIAASWSGNYLRKTGTLTACDYEMKPTSEREFVNALITETTIPACDGASKEPAYLTVKFAPEYTRKVAPGTSRPAADNKVEQKMWLPANFVLQIDGLDCRGVTKVDSFTVKQTAVTDDIGDARDYAKEPGKLDFPNLRITLTENSAAAWEKWHEDFVIIGNNDEGFEKNGCLIFLSPNRKNEIARIELKNLGIFKLDQMKGEANADHVRRVTVELYCEKMVFSYGTKPYSGSPPAESTGAGGTTEATATATDTAPGGTAGNAAANTGGGTDTAPGGTTVGTAQLPGPDGKLGEVYKMRTERPLFFSLKRMEYTTAQVKMGDSFYVPEAGEKLLVLHYTIQNPNETNELVRSDSLRFTAVDAASVNYEGRATWGVEETGMSLNTQLFPAQTVKAYTVISVPAKGVIPKLIVQPNDNGPLLRFDLRDKVAGLPAPIADPEDRSGATARGSVPGVFNTSYPYEHFTVSVEKYEYTADALGREAPHAGERYLVFTLLVKNMAPTEQLLRADTFEATLTSTDEEELPRVNTMLFATTNRPIAQMSQPGQEMRVRVFFTVPQGVTPKTLALQEGESRKYTFRLADQPILKPPLTERIPR